MAILWPSCSSRDTLGLHPPPPQHLPQHTHTHSKPHQEFSLTNQGKFAVRGLSVEHKHRFDAFLQQMQRTVEQSSQGTEKESEEVHGADEDREREDRVEGILNSRMGGSSKVWQEMDPY